MTETGASLHDLDIWLTPFLAVLGRKTRRTWAPLYVRGLLGPGERKNLQPMARQLGLGGHDQLQHFIASRAWDDGPLWTVLAHEADRMIGGPDAVLVIDDTALPKKGTLSVGGAAVLRAAGQAGELPGAGFADPGRQGGSGPSGIAAVPAAGVDRRPRALCRSGGAGRGGHRPQQRCHCAR